MNSAPYFSPHSHTTSTGQRHSQVSRLQDGAEVSKEVYTKAKDHLKQPVDDYILYWPERKVTSSNRKPQAFKINCKLTHYF